MKEIDNIELAGAEVPSFKESAAGVPDDISGTQQLEEGTAARVARVVGSFIHANGLPSHCSCVNN